jgi:hypothetical protein
LDRKNTYPLFVGQGLWVGGIADMRLSAVVEFDFLAGPAIRAVDELHALAFSFAFSRAVGQCATPAAPCSSTRAPVMDRSTV